MSEVTAPTAGENSSVIDVERWSSTKQETPEPSQAESVAANESEPVEAATEPARAEEPKTEEKKEIESRPSRDWRIDEYYRLKALERQYAEGGAPKPAVEQQKLVAAVSADDPEPVWDADKYSSKGGYDAFVKELGRHSARQEFRALQEQEKASRAQHEAQRKQSGFAQRVAASGITDYAEVVQAAQRGIANPELLTAILESEQGPQLAYHLAKNPADVDRINSLSPRSQLIELGKLEARFAQSNPVQTQQPTGISKAPPPVQPLRPKAATPKTDLNSLLTDGSNFREAANAMGIPVQRGRWGRYR